MSARGRAAPWFGALGERLEAAEDEARTEDALRSTRCLAWFWLGEGLPAYQGLGEVQSFVLRVSERDTP